MNDLDISRGFEAGNYACAYDTAYYELAIAKLSPNRSAEYLAAYTLGFFSSYETYEMSDRRLKAYLDAYSLVGNRAIALGMAVDRQE